MATLRNTPSSRLPRKPEATMMAAVARLGRSNRLKNPSPGGVARSTMGSMPEGAAQRTYRYEIVSCAPVNGKPRRCRLRPLPYFRHYAHL